MFLIRRINEREWHRAADKLRSDDKDGPIVASVHFCRKAHDKDDLFAAWIFVVSRNEQGQFIAQTSCTDRNTALSLQHDINWSEDYAYESKLLEAAATSVKYTSNIRIA